ncbi:AAA family ATPase [Curtobacterium sp. MCPF17_021]|uniref:McrB family protein n=1 Tax=Curtobacterium sp. MCPF17_021 TaxID=2175639 RepID=UPI000DA97BE5|nr:AAA family ATPase [Curtobacterium sp. MCPF17_021]WIE82802.1 AAA family ATPase [Curtobacterium sp. MCPF17_021]
MPYQPVEAVFVVFYGLAAHKATYGRLSGGYSKDYLQLTQDEALRQALLRLFPSPTTADDSIPITYVWPNGEQSGFIKLKSADRPHLAWPFSEAPLPWKMSPAPSASGPETLLGDPSHTDQADATREYDKWVASGDDAYLVAVKLREEPDRLHVRTYVRGSANRLDYADVSHLPDDVRDLVESTTRTRAFAWATFDDGAMVPPGLAAAVEKLDENPSLLLVGPPGTGKTVLLEALVDFVTNPRQTIYFDPDANHDAWDVRSGGEPGKARSVVLHPSYQYDNLVVGLLPEPSESGGVGVRVSPGPLVSLAHYASENGRRALLVLDEFNRANAAAVLGDTLALLDKDKRSQAFIDLPYADMTIEVPNEFEANGTTTVPHSFTLPKDLWIVAAMNTSDRSVAPLDAALRRRFTIVEVPPDYDLLSERLGADEDLDLSVDVAGWTVGHVGSLAVHLLRELNRRIDAVLGPDFRLGHSNFWHVGGPTVDDALLSLASAFDHRVVQSLRLSLQDDDGSLAAIFRAGPADQPTSRANSVATWVQPDPELNAFASDRLHFRDISTLNADQSLNELLAQARLK